MPDHHRHRMSNASSSGSSDKNRINSVAKDRHTDDESQSLNQHENGSIRNNRFCCFCWCCCCTCHCLTVQPQAANARPSIPPKPEEIEIPMELITYEELRLWNRSLDHMMSRSQVGRLVFQKFLRSEYSEENILFWLACEELKRMEDQEVDVTLREGLARHIYEEYISVLSPKEVSLDSKIRDSINDMMIQPNSRTFAEAQQSIFTLMQRDSYRRFFKSNTYIDLLRSLLTPEELDEWDAMSSNPEMGLGDIIDRFLPPEDMARTSGNASFHGGDNAIASVAENAIAADGGNAIAVAEENAAEGIGEKAEHAPSDEEERMVRE